MGHATSVIGATQGVELHCSQVTTLTANERLFCRVLAAEVGRRRGKFKNAQALRYKSQEVAMLSCDNQQMRVQLPNLRSSSVLASAVRRNRVLAR